MLSVVAMVIQNKPGGSYPWTLMPGFIGLSGHRVQCCRYTNVLWFVKFTVVLWMWIAVFCSWFLFLFRGFTVVLWMCTSFLFLISVSFSWLCGRSVAFQLLHWRDRSPIEWMNELSRRSLHLNYSKSQNDNQRNKKRDFLFPLLFFPFCCVILSDSSVGLSVLAVHFSVISIL